MVVLCVWCQVSEKGFEGARTSHVFQRHDVSVSRIHDVIHEFSPPFASLDNCDSNT